MRRTLTLLMAVSAALATMLMATAGADPTTEGPNKVWLCHFEDNHTATQPYTDDRNGTEPGFWTVDPATTSFANELEYLDGDYIVRWNPTASGLNSGQVALCTGNGGTFELVSVKAISSFDETPRGHRAQNLGATTTYPDGYKG